MFLAQKYEHLPKDDIAQAKRSILNSLTSLGCGRGSCCAPPFEKASKRS